MHRRNAFLTAALLLAGVAACTYNPSFQVDASTLVCKDNNGCPSGYHCALKPGEQTGFCCNKSDNAACFGPQDRLLMRPALRTDVLATDAPPNLNGTSDGSAPPDVNPADRGATQVTDSSSPSFVDATADLAGDRTGSGGTGGSGNSDAAGGCQRRPVVPATLRLPPEALVQVALAVRRATGVRLPPEALVQVALAARRAPGVLRLPPEALVGAAGAGGTRLPPEALAQAALAARRAPGEPRLPGMQARPWASLPRPQ